MNVTISNIFCSTAIITVDSRSYQVCYWNKHNTPAGGLFPPREIVWVDDKTADKVYELKSHGYHEDVKHLIPLFRALCDINYEKFDCN